MDDGHRAEHLDRANDDLDSGPASPPERALLREGSSEEMDGVRRSPASEVSSVGRDIAPSALSRGQVERGSALAA